YTFRNIRGDSSIRVVYKPFPKFTVSTLVINGMITDTSLIDSSSNLTVTYMPNQNFVLDSIYINGVYQPLITLDSIIKYTFVNIRGDSSIRVVYKFNGFVINASVVDTGNINANVNPSGAVMVVKNSSQTFIFSYPNNSVFDSLFIDGMKVDTVSTYTFTNVTKNHTIVGYFHEIFVPDSVTNLKARGANNSVVLSFDSPLNNGGSRILYYRIRSTDNGANIDILDSLEGYSPFVVRGLTNGLSYCFTVTAVNKVGESIPNRVCVIPQGNIYSITTSVENGMITRLFAIDSGMDSTITYTNNKYYLLDSIFINGNYNQKVTQDSTRQYTFKNIRGDSSIAVKYRAFPKYNIYTSVKNGMITDTSLIDSTRDFTVTYNNNPFFLIDSIFINGNYSSRISQDSISHYTFYNIRGDSSIRVVYKPFPKFTITTSVKNGSITNPTIVDSSSNFKVIYLPQNKYLIDSIFINGNYNSQVTKDSISHYTFNNIRGDSSIRVVFKPFPKVNVFTSVNNGQITASTQVDSSDSFTVTYSGN
ncbi:MAG: fibronectin type III domain-containing protein, partial [Sediminibacterium sp.]|nr:fibronectin type III domain-containing protein [Sediminibacterium sp.]